MSNVSQSTAGADGGQPTTVRAICLDFYLRRKNALFRGTMVLQVISQYCSIEKNPNRVTSSSRSSKTERSIDMLCHTGIMQSQANEINHGKCICETSDSSNNFES